MVSSEYETLKDKYDKLEREVEIEFEAHTFYKREWESACERYNSMELDHDELKARVDKLVGALKAIAAHPDVVATQGLFESREAARQALAAYEGLV